MLRTHADDTISINQNRPTYAPAQSICRSVRGFETVDTYPIRSPLAVADFLAPIVQGRGFTEIGTRAHWPRFTPRSKASPPTRTAPSRLAAAQGMATSWAASPTLRAG
jgi:hypothetical protein